MNSKDDPLFQMMSKQADTMKQSSQPNTQQQQIPGKQAQDQMMMYQQQMMQFEQWKRFQQQQMGYPQMQNPMWNQQMFENGSPVSMGTPNNTTPNSPFMTPQSNTPTQLPPQQFGNQSPQNQQQFPNQQSPNQFMNTPFPNQQQFPMYGQQFGQMFPQQQFMHQSNWYPQQMAYHGSPMNAPNQIPKQQSPTTSTQQQLGNHGPQMNSPTLSPTNSPMNVPNQQQLPNQQPFSNQQIPNRQSPNVQNHMQNRQSPVNSPNQQQPYQHMGFNMSNQQPSPQNQFPNQQSPTGFVPHQQSPIQSVQFQQPSHPNQKQQSPPGILPNQQSQPHLQNQFQQSPTGFSPNQQQSQMPNQQQSHLNQFQNQPTITPKQFQPSPTGFAPIQQQSQLLDQQPSHQNQFQQSSGFMPQQSPTNFPYQMNPSHMMGNSQMGFPQMNSQSQNMMNEPSITSPVQISPQSPSVEPKSEPIVPQSTKNDLFSFDEIMGFAPKKEPAQAIQTPPKTLVQEEEDEEWADFEGANEPVSTKSNNILPIETESFELPKQIIPMETKSIELPNESLPIEKKSSPVFEIPRATAPPKKSISDILNSFNATSSPITNQMPSFESGFAMQFMPKEPIKVVHEENEEDDWADFESGQEEKTENAKISNSIPDFVDSTAIPEHIVEPKSEPVASKPAKNDLFSFDEIIMQTTSIELPKDQKIPESSFEILPNAPTPKVEQLVIEEEEENWADFESGETIEESKQQSNEKVDVVPIIEEIPKPSVEIEPIPQQPVSDPKKKILDLFSFDTISTPVIIPQAIVHEEDDWADFESGQEEKTLHVEIVDVAVTLTESKTESNSISVILENENQIVANESVIEAKEEEEWADFETATQVEEKSDVKSETKPEHEVKSSEIVGTNEEIKSEENKTEVKKPAKTDILSLFTSETTAPVVHQEEDDDDWGDFAAAEQHEEELTPQQRSQIMDELFTNVEIGAIRSRVDHILFNDWIDLISKSDAEDVKNFVGKYSPDEFTQRKKTASLTSVNELQSWKTDRVNEMKDLLRDHVPSMRLFVECLTDLELTMQFCDKLRPLKPDQANRVLNQDKIRTYLHAIIIMEDICRILAPISSYRDRLDSFRDACRSFVLESTGKDFANVQEQQGEKCPLSGKSLEGAEITENEGIKYYTPAINIWLRKISNKYP
jgi:hypothetical protein